MGEVQPANQFYYLCLLLKLYHLLQNIKKLDLSHEKIDIPPLLIAISGLPDAFCENTGHFGNRDRSKLCCIL